MVAWLVKASGNNTGHLPMVVGIPLGDINTVRNRNLLKPTLHIKAANLPQLVTGSQIRPWLQAPH